MKNPAISVVIPVYNQEKYVGKCIRSVLGQSFQGFEAIVVNDGSTDKSLKICQKYAQKDKRVTVIDKQNEGVVLARRDGFLKAKGEYICFLDSDDYLASSALEKLYKLAIDHNVDLVIGNHCRVIDNWGLVKWGFTPFANSDRLICGPKIMDLMWGYYGDANNLGYLWGRLYKRSCILKAIDNNAENIFKKDLKIIEDIYANISIAPFLKTVWITNEVLCYYRYGGSLSKIVPLIRNAGSVFDKQVELCEQYDKCYILPTVFKRYVGLLNSNLLSEIHNHAYSEEDIKEFLLNELKSRSLVQWASKNLQVVEKAEYKSYFELRVDDILDSIKRREKSLWRHYLLKKIVLTCQRIVSFF